MTDEFNNIIGTLPKDDSEWSEDDWKALLFGLISEGLVSYKEITTCILGQ